MHREVRSFIKQVRRKHPFKFFRSRVLEVGSQDVNGSPRKYFIRCRYTGIDLEKGKGVDRIHNIVEPVTYLGRFDVVISCECLEHCDGWGKALLNMYDAVKQGGLLIITCASDNRPEHGTKRTDEFSSPFTTDYYRNISIEDFSEVLQPGLFKSYTIENRRDDQDLMFYGIKK